MDTLKPVDGVEVLILVDNATDNLSSVPSFVETEFAALERLRRGRWVSAGNCLCCAAFGLSCLITVRQGSATRTLLFDTGPEDARSSRMSRDWEPISDRSRPSFSHTVTGITPVRCCAPCRSFATATAATTLLAMFTPTCSEREP